MPGQSKNQFLKRKGWEVIVDNRDPFLDLGTNQGQEDRPSGPYPRMQRRKGRVWINMSNANSPSISFRKSQRHNEWTTPFQFASKKYITQNVLNGTTHTFSGIKLEDVFQKLALQYQLPGALIPATGTIDPTNVSTGDANLINGVLTDLCYNNSSNGTTNKALPAIDLGTSQTVGGVNLYRWNTTYIATSFRIEYSTNGTSWNTAGTYSGAFLGTATATELTFTPVTARYVRVFCISGANASWVVVSELQALGVGSLVDIETTGIEGVTISANGSGDTILNNNTWQDLDFKISYL